MAKLKDILSKLLEHPFSPVIASRDLHLAGLERYFKDLSKITSRKVKRQAHRIHFIKKAQKLGFFGI